MSTSFWKLFLNILEIDFGNKIGYADIGRLEGVVSMARQPSSLLQDFPDLQPGTAAYRLAALVDADGRGSAEIGRKAGVGPSAIRHWIDRPSTKWTAELVAPVARELGVTAEEICPGHVTPLRAKTTQSDYELASGRWPGWRLWRSGSVLTISNVQIRLGDDVIVIGHPDDNDLMAAIENGPWVVVAGRLGEMEPILTVERADCTDRQEVLESQCLLISGIRRK